MPKKQTIASAKYNAKAYEEIKLRVKSGQKERIQKQAQNKGESVNGYIKTAVEERYKAETKEEL